MTMMGREIAAKLFEFNKVVRRDVEGDHRIYFSATLDVIVPETPDCNKPGAST